MFSLYITLVLTDFFRSILPPSFFLTCFQVDTERQLLFLKGGVPGTKGGFVRIVDAVKGPFHPSPPPFPTYLDPPTNADGTPAVNRQIFAPLPEEDTGIFKEPDNPY
jgi:hypothetical protein